MVARSITGRSGGCELTMEIISLSCDLVVRKKQFVNKLWINSLIIFCGVHTACYTG